MVELSKAGEPEQVDLSLTFKTDGTPAGTKVKVNGQDVEDLVELTLAYSVVLSEEGKPEASIVCSYEVSSGEPNSEGFRTSQQFRLVKGLDLLMEEEESPAELEKAKWTRAYINDLPDSAFLYIEPGGEKDEEGKTKPRSLRHFPYKDKNGKIDLPHLRNAISRIPQSNLPDSVKEKLQAKARRLLEQAKKTSKVIDKAADADLEALRAVAEGVPEDIDGQLAKALAKPAEVVAQYRGDLPQDLAKAIEEIITLACQTEEAEEISEENDVTKAAEDQKAQDQQDGAQGAAQEDAQQGQSNQSPALSEEDVNRIADKVAEKLLAAQQAKKDQKDQKDQADKTEGQDNPAGDKPEDEVEEEEVSPAELGQEIAEAVVEAIGTEG